MYTKLNNLIAKPHKTAVIAMLAILSMAGTMTAEANGLDIACAASGNDIVCAKSPGTTQAIPEPTTLALISVGLIGAFGARRRK